MAEQRFRTMWYKSKPGPEDFTIADLDTRNSWYRLAFITRRSAIECPPYTYIVQKDLKPIPVKVARSLRA
jgi:ATP-dependent helicase HepA